MWLVTALRPMRLHELLEGVTIDPIRRVLDPGFILIQGLDFLEVSRSLVVHNKETDIVALSHMSVKEYLVGDLVQAKLPRYHIVLEDAHEHLARLCMAYISFCLEEMKECRDRSSNTTREQDLMLTTSYASRPLLKYVLSYGFSHLSHLEFGNAGILEDMETLQVVICRRTWEWDHLRKLVPSTPPAIPWPGSEHDSMMYNLVAFASDALFDTYLGRPTLTPREGTNPLVYATHFGKTVHAEALILRGANVNHWGLVVDEPGADDEDEDDMDVDGSDGDDMDTDTSITDYSDARAVPIQVAVDHWHAEMLDLLLAHGSIIPDRLLTRVLSVQPHRFPLYIIRRLLQTAEFITWAATPWDNRRLLEAVFDDEDSYEQINGGDELELVIKGLVQAGCAEALLLVAVEKGCIPVIGTLLSIKPSSSPDTLHAIVDAFANNGDTPLHIAMRLSNENQCLIITKLLVEAGCNPSAFNANDKPPLYTAVVRGFLSVVKYLLSQDVSLPPRILVAAFQTSVVKRVEMIRLLISKGANIHVLSPDGDTLLHIAMRSPDRSVCLEIVEILMDVGCNPSTINARSETPLHIAAKQGYHETLNYLILFRSSSEISSLLEDDSALQSATWRSLIGNSNGIHFSPEKEAGVRQAVRRFLDEQDECLECAKIFVGAAGDLFARSPGCAMLFDIAVRRGFIQVVEYLKSQAVPFPTAILFTALRYQMWMIPSFLGVDLHVRDGNGDSPLHVAMLLAEEAQCLKATQILIEAGCDPVALNPRGKTPFHLAVTRGFASLVEYLLSQDVPLPSNILFSAIASQYFHWRNSDSDNRIPIISLLVCKGANVHVQDSRKNTLLHHAMRIESESDCVEVTKLFIEAGCSASAPNADCELPIELAVTRAFPSVVEYLLSRHAPFPPNILFTAQECRDTPDSVVLQMVSLFVKQGANVCGISANGDTVLHAALSRKMFRSPWDEVCLLDIADVLVRAGCDTQAHDAIGGTPLELATAMGYHSVAKYLGHISPLRKRLLQSPLAGGLRRVLSSVFPSSRNT
ncbi:ankyrin repeat-containing domain protein [Boletus edulis BED1]|uniref:Ankyrin repeat-containing domain protein n=1 Tax=Boletus edulis BED1 TaxID=1328754 RepID=A0AAD4BBS0_BOLED|nr:ankyrin repeat-containing domain protein [Boletus edulis BED1]